MMKLSKEQFRKRMITDRNMLKRKRASKKKSVFHETERVLRKRGGRQW